MKNISLYFILLLQLTFYLNGQIKDTDVISSLVEKEYDELRVDFRKLPLDTIASLPFARAFLKKAQLENDTLKLAEGYHILSNISNMELSLKYADSIIFIMKGRPKTDKYPAFGYLQKGRLSYRKGKYDKALNFYIKCLELTDNSNSSLSAGVNFNIGLINNLIGNKKEALIYFNKYNSYLNKSKLANKDYYKTRIYYAKSDVFLFSNNVDSALHFARKGQELSLDNNDTLYFSRFALNTGIAFYQQKDYHKSLNSLTNIKRDIQKDNDPTIKALYNLYVAKVLIAIDKKNESFEYLKKSEAIILDSNEILPELLETFVLLKDYYEINNDSKNQLSTINYLLKYDSIVDTYASSLTGKIKYEYEIPNLIRDKEVIISQLDREKVRKNNFLISSLIVILTLILLLYIYAQRNKKLRRRFQKLIQENEQEKNHYNFKKNVEDLGISKELVEEILLKLRKFEDGNRYTLKKYTLSSLASELNTNSSYLSKIINFHKKVNFANYLNNLKVDYATKKLLTDKRYRLYTIKAIAKECGFNSSQSFTTAFYKKNGIYPSYFIKQLDKNDS